MMYFSLHFLILPESGSMSSRNEDIKFAHWQLLALRLRVEMYINTAFSLFLFRVLPFLSCLKYARVETYKIKFRFNARLCPIEKYFINGFISVSNT